MIYVIFNYKEFKQSNQLDLLISIYIIMKNRNKQDFFSVHEYVLKFTQLYRYAPEMVLHMRSIMGLFDVGLSHLSRKQGRAPMLIWNIDI